MTLPGAIIGPHGVRGELKVKIESDFADTRLTSNSLLFLRKPSRRSPRPVQLLTGRKQADGLYLISIKGISSRIAAMTFVGFDLFVAAGESLLNYI